MKHWMVLSLALCASLAATGAEAAAKKRAKAKLTTLSGCTHLMMPSCVSLTQRGTTYRLDDAVPVLLPGIRANVVGYRNGKVSLCGGTGFQVVRWTPGTGALCPPL